MSWFGALKNTSNSRPTVSPRTAKRNQLDAERKERAHKRIERKKQLEATLRAEREADEAILNLLDLDPDIFEGEDELIIDDEEVSELLAEEETMAENFDELNTDNGADAIKSLGQIKVSWDAENPEYFFQKLETELQIFSINKQFTKRQALIRSLPDEVAKEFMHLVTLQETEAGTLSYKVLKTALIKAYGPRPEDAFQKAMNRVMLGKPSSLLKLLITDICKQNMLNCCCNRTIWGIFQMKIPMYLKTGLANETFNQANMHGIMDRADNLWAANQNDKQVSVVSTSSTTSATPSTNPSTPSDNTTEVAAIGRGRGTFRGRNRGFRNRGGRGGGRGAQNGPDPRGKRHESNPAWNCCAAHWVHAEKAWRCQAPTTCPMVNKTTPKA